MSRFNARLPLAATAVTVVTLIAGCGSSSSGSPSASNAGGPQTEAQSVQRAVNFAGCMRSHGVPDFPDPTTSPHAFKQSLDPSVPHSPAFLSGARACRHLLPNAGVPEQSSSHTQAQIAAFLAFARCLRSHGLPSFPDPTSRGELTHEMLAAAGIDIHLPAVQQAADACVGVTHGVITRAAVARFVAGR